jgi:ferredoxin-NADP reductase
MALKTFELTLQWAKMLNPNVRHLAFKRDDGEAFDYIPGQFITFLMPSADSDKPVRRSYSVASIHGQSDEIEIAVGYVPEGLATDILSQLNPGDSLTASGPFGRLILYPEKDVDKRLIMIATGTGITPYRAMIPQFAELLQTQKNQVVVIQGVREREELLYAEDFLQLARAHDNFSYHACISREFPAAPEAYEHQGHVQAVFEQLQLDSANDVVYLCGNPNMIDDCFNLLKAQAFEPANVRREKYISGS